MHVVNHKNLDHSVLDNTIWTMATIKFLNQMFTSSSSTLFMLGILPHGYCMKLQSDLIVRFVYPIGCANCNFCLQNLEPNHFQGSLQPSWLCYIVYENIMQFIGFTFTITPTWVIATSWISIVILYSGVHVNIAVSWNIFMQLVIDFLIILSPIYVCFWD